VRRLQISAHVLEVSRRENSVVEIRTARDPVSAWIEDADALALTTELPSNVAARVVPGFCRGAIEAACMETVRRKRLARGERHADIERELERAHKVTQIAALAIFDDVDRGGDVMTWLNKNVGPWAGTAFKQCKEGAHGAVVGGLQGLVADVRKLSGRLATLS
jgi:hypothetical protein